MPDEWQFFLALLKDDKNLLVKTQLSKTFPFDWYQLIRSSVFYPRYLVHAVKKNHASYSGFESYIAIIINLPSFQSAEAC